MFPWLIEEATCKDPSQQGRPHQMHPEKQAFFILVSRKQFSFSNVLLDSRFLLEGHQHIPLVQAAAAAGGVVVVNPQPSRSLKMSKNLDETYIGQYLLTLFDVAGPPVLLLMGASLLHVVALSLPWIAYQFTFCTDHSADMEYNYFLWVPFLVWTTLTTFIEPGLQ